MKIPFFKYQGTGNDFVMIDNRINLFDKTNISAIQHLCDRRFGIGSDGLILIENLPDFDFNMVFFNPDGSQSFCGNGSRCAVAFAKFLGIIDNQAYFNSTDGEHEAWVSANGDISLKMHDVKLIEKGDGYYFINTGSPHYIKEETNLKELDVVSEGREIRYNDRFKEEGTNVNFVKYNQESLDIRTYERGVEGETLSCGTGVTAAALSWADKFKLSAGKVDVNAQGGKLSVGFKRNENGFNDIWLIGPAQYVFKGEIEV
ncbi:diaminopimelate epimerase [Vicingus serpentipes]|uniref:Diaminopimelate epimerase n=1 Tax=Vicingus serpentipes TaxID=1926625 RepID=A0A5C6RXM3_9FLAO|nr:diaminopimelate epimerase [Vicingus serpentipes]TXB66102.1 diaminopimelate epimerase [Vicingus serpentipes]